MSRRIAFRVDGDAHVGLGHLSLCRSLARSFARELGAACHFVMLERSRTPAVEAWLEAAGIERWSASGDDPDRTCPERERAALAAIDPDLVVLDRLTADPSDGDFHADPGVELIDVPKVLDALRRAGHRVLAVTYESRPVAWPCDALLAIHPGQLAHAVTEGPVRFVGPRYYPVDPDLAELRERSAPLEGPLCASLFFGGADPDGLTLRAARALRECGAELHVVLGAVNPLRGAALAELEACVTSVRRAPASLIGELAQSQLAVTAAGHTLFELAWLGMPALVLSTRDRQADSARYFDDQGAVAHLGRFDRVDDGALRAAFEGLLRAPERRARMRESGRTLVDGHGARRIAARLREEGWL